MKEQRPVRGAACQQMSAKVARCVPPMRGGALVFRQLYAGIDDVEMDAAAAGAAHGAVFRSGPSGDDAQDGKVTAAFWAIGADVAGGRRAQPAIKW